MDIYTINKKLIGSIAPYGDTGIDDERLSNLEKHINLTYELVRDLCRTADFRNRHEYSIVKLADKAYEALDEIKELIDNLEDEE